MGKLRSVNLVDVEQPSEGVPRGRGRSAAASVVARLLGRG